MWGSKRKQRWSQEWLHSPLIYLSELCYENCAQVSPLSSSYWGVWKQEGGCSHPPLHSAGQGRIPVISMLSWSVLWVHGAFTLGFPFADRLALLPPPPCSPGLRPPNILYPFLLPKLAVWSGLESRVWTLPDKSWATHWSACFPRIGKY